MLALAIALILFGYTVAYAGAQNYSNPGQGISLAAAFTCATAGGPTPVSEPGSQGSSTPGSGTTIRTPGGQTVQVPAPFVSPDISSIGPGSIGPGTVPSLQRYGTIAGAGIFGQVVTAGMQGFQTIVSGAQNVLSTLGGGARATACSYLGIGC